MGTQSMCLVPGVVGVCGHKVAGLKIKFWGLSLFGRIQQIPSSVLELPEWNLGG